ncbi:MAG: hypothetical protein ABFE07_15110 [Armatimonadia bacterium]
MMNECQTLKLMRKPGPPALLVSLPANDPDLARAARDGGAQGLKVHINIEHAAAKVRFGSLDDEATRIEEIASLGLPVGIVPGDASRMAPPEDFRRLHELGLDFADLYLGAMPAWLLSALPLPLMAALGHEDMSRPDRLASVATLTSIGMIEASIIPHTEYGNPLSAGDLADYTTFTRILGQADRPVIVPTQRHIVPDDLAALASTGIRALLIGAIVTGRTAADISAATRVYREALDQL